MNEKLPYEHELNQKWDDIPLPDENLSWNDMKRRLDEDEDKKPVAWWLRPGCLLTGLLVAMLIGAGWLLLKPGKDNKNKTTQPAGRLHTQRNYDTPAINITNDNWPEADKNQSGRLAIDTPVKKTNDSIDEVQKTHNTTHTQKSEISRTIIPGQKRTKTKNVNPGPKRYNRKPARNAKPGKQKEFNDSISPTGITIITKPDINKDTVLMAVNQSGPSKVTSSDTLVTQKDSVQKKVAPVLNQKDTTAPSKTDSSRRADKKKKTPFILSAGISLHQQLPVAGQQLTPYNSLGRKSGFADYIPAPYIRLEKEKKWFLETGFRYGAPQSVKGFVYRQVNVTDTGSNPRYTNITSYSLKKIFYHQLPLTFNYYIRPGWSVGAGVQWNKLYAAVAGQEVNRKNILLQRDSVISKLIVSQKSDSLTEFRKSYWQAIIETQYQWKRFSSGLRYSFGLQPYIKFTLPGGLPQQERNNAVQVFIRYRLWKQKK